MKKVISETQLLNIIKESIKEVLNESIYGNDYFTSTTTMDDVNDDDDNEERETRIIERLREVDELTEADYVGVILADEDNYVPSNNQFHPYISIFAYSPNIDYSKDVTARVLVNGKVKDFTWKQMTEKMKRDIENILNV